MMVFCRPLNQPFDCSWPAVIGELFFAVDAELHGNGADSLSKLSQTSLFRASIQPLIRVCPGQSSTSRPSARANGMLLTRRVGSRLRSRLGSVSSWVARRSSPGWRLLFASPSSQCRMVRCLALKSLTGRIAADIDTEHLERCGIAWPNPAMFENPLVPKQQVASNNSGFTFPGMDGGFHKRNYSNGSANNLSSPLRGIPQPPPPSPAWGFYNFRGLQPPYDGLDARGVSMPSAFNSEQISHALGSLSCAMTGPAASASMAGNVSLPPINNFAPNANQQLQVRLPSDQLQKLISALKSGTQHETRNPSHSQAMPPPPLPPHALAAKGGFTGQDGLPHAGHGEHYQAASTTIRNAGPRDESRGSDVSMHTACAYFPTCMTEDDAGQVIHGSPAPATPSYNIKGKKEGSSPAKREVPSSKQSPFRTDQASSPRLHVHDPRSARKRIHNIRRRRREDFHTPIIQPSRDTRSQAHPRGS